MHVTRFSGAGGADAGSVCARYASYGLSAMVAVAPFIWIDALEDPAHLPRYAFVEVLVPLLAGGLLLARLPSGRCRIVLPPISWPVAGWVSMALISSLFATNKHDALVQTVHIAGMAGLFFLSAAIACRGPEPVLRRVIYTAVGGGCLVALVGLAQNFGLLGGLYSQSLAPAATMVHRNVLGQYLDLLFFPALTGFLLSRNRFLMWLATLAVSLLGAMLLLTYSRGSWLGLSMAALGAAVMLASMTRLRSAVVKRFRALPAGKWIAVVFLSVSPVVFLTIPSPVTGGTMALKLRDTLVTSPDSNVSYRLALYANTWQMIKDHPFGVGPGNWRSTYQAYHARIRPTPYYGERVQTDQVHNDILSYMAELGIFGGAFFLAILVMTVNRVLRLLRAPCPSTSSRLLIFGIFLALLDVVIHSLVSFPFHNATSSILIWIWTGLIAGTGLGLSGAVRACWFPGRKTVGLLALAGLSVAVSAGVYDYRFLTGDGLQKRAQVLYATGECEQALRTIDRAVTTFPHHYRSRQRHAMIHSHCDGQRGRALAIALSLASDEPYYLNNLINLMPLAEENGRLDLVGDTAQRLVTVYRELPMGYHGMGIYSMRSGDLSAARAWFRQALGKDAHYRPSLAMLAELGPE